MRAIQRQKGVSRLLDENQRIRFDDAGVETTRIEPELPVKADVSRFAKDSGLPSKSIFQLKSTGVYSSISPVFQAGVAKWQTQQTQNLPVATP